MESPQPFKVDQSTIFKPFLLSPRTGWPLWVVLGIGILVSAFGCLTDIRWLIVGLIVCLAVLPMVAFFLMLGYVSRPEVVANLLPHTLERTPEGYLLRVFRPMDEDECEAAEARGWKESGRMLLRDCHIVSKESTFEYEVVSYRDSELKILYVPRY